MKNKKKIVLYKLLYKKIIIIFVNKFKVKKFFNKKASNNYKAKNCDKKNYKFVS